MASDPLFIVTVLVVLSVLAVLAVGILGFGKGGEFNRKHGNRMMRYRLVAQAIAVALIVLFVFVRSSGG